MDLSQFRQKYVEDATELLDNLDNALLSLEKDKQNQEYSEQIFRIMHTLKGSGAMYGFDKIVELTHQLESLYNLIRDNKVSVSDEIIQVTFFVADHIRDLLQNDNVDEVKHLKILEKINFVAKKAEIEKTVEKIVFKETEIKNRTWKIVFKPDESIFERNINIVETLHCLFLLGKCEISVQENEEKVWNIILQTEKTQVDIEDALFFISNLCEIEILKEEIIEIDTNQENVSPNIPTSQGKNEVLKYSTSRIMVDSTKLDTLLYLVSELVTTKSELLLSVEKRNYIKIAEATEKIDNLSKLFRDNALNIRLISLRDMLNRFQRLVHDLSHQLNKQIDFEINGEDTELDKNIVDAIAEPIMHLIRNSIDHGIETPEERIKAGKKPTGIVKFFAYKSGSFVFIQISDDGHGINKQKIRQKAIEKGFLNAEKQLSDKEIYDLIFIPGFSTAESITQVSGRGVGMDIVKHKIQDIRGEISIDSEEGLGTYFTLKLQQTISIIDTMLIRSHNSIFAIPVEDIENCELISKHELLQKHNKQISYQNELIPYLHLNEEFQFPESQNEKLRIIVINKQEKRFAIISDEIIGEYQAVVKPLSKTFSEIEFLSGACILGDRNIALLFDTEKLKNLISHS